ncbi:uncharacterized protein LOC116552304 [Sapajus apella]|uniref:Uncharacterized protein LOC116552304 n=1 Tax=Sapajus apella TaxID=9515 RepID=A0A6J3HZ16_SAPAP|nr:uncharacterized protein LOC116552304 [Sapajus apella]
MPYDRRPGARPSQVVDSPPSWLSSAPLRSHPRGPGVSGSFAGIALLKFQARARRGEQRPDSLNAVPPIPDSREEGAALCWDLNSPSLGFYPTVKCATGSATHPHPPAPCSHSHILSLEFFVQFEFYSNTQRLMEKTWETGGKKIQRPFLQKALPQSLALGALEAAMQNAPGEVRVAGVQTHRGIFGGGHRRSFIRGWKGNERNEKSDSTSL